jgi:hypothetical protein
MSRTVCQRPADTTQMSGRWYQLLVSSDLCPPAAPAPVTADDYTVGHGAADQLLVRRDGGVGVVRRLPLRGHAHEDGGGCRDLRAPTGTAPPHGGWGRITP